MIQIDRLRIAKPVLQITTLREKIRGTQAPVPALVKMAESQCAKTADVNNKPRVSRLQNLPTHMDRISAVEFLCDPIDGLMA